MRKSLASFANTVVNVERGFFHTSIMLFKSPGVVIADYIRGNTRPYMHPVRYAFTLLTLGLIVFQFYDVSEFESLIGDQENAPFSKEKSMELAMKYSNFIVLVMYVPFMGLASWMLNRKTQTNYAEHVIAMLYVVGHNSIYTLLFTPLILLSPDQNSAASILSLLALVLAIYQIHRTWLENRRSVALLKSVVVPVLGFITVIISAAILSIVGVLIVTIIGEVWK